MLDFFRKYQRYFFIVIAVVIVISFSFFGTYQSMGQQTKVADRPIGKLVDGKKMMKKEVDQMARFLSSDRNDHALAEKGMMPNYFNNGVIRHDLMGSGMGTLLVHAYFDDIKEELKERMVHHKGYRPYVHPMAPFISIENLWAQVLPAQKKNLATFLHQSPEMTPDTFSLLVDLYVGETAFPSNILRDYLLFQEKHYEWIQPDPALPRANLNLFRCASIEDWFGHGFVELAAQFVLNAAAYAKEKGYKVSYEEARVDLVRQGYESIQLQTRKSEVSQEEVAQLWKQAQWTLGVNEKEMVELWQKVMLFRRLFDDVGSAVFVDPQTYQAFYGFASKTAEVDLYRLPDEVSLKDFSSLMKLEYYLDQVAKNTKEGLLLPQAFDPVDTVEKRCPDLVRQRFVVEVAEVAIDDVALNVSMKEMWQWQLEKENFELLEKEFPKLALKKGSEAESYFAALEGMDREYRQKIDKFSRRKIAETHPEWIEEAIGEKRFAQVTLKPSKDGDVSPYGGKELCALLTKAAPKEVLETDPEALKARRALELYSSDGKTYYRFHLLEKDLEKRVLTFQEADQEGILDHLLSDHLEKAYQEVRLKNPAVFKNEKNEWKPFDEVKMEVGRLFYSDKLQAIEKEAASLGIPVPADKEKALDTFYAQCRLFPHLVAAEKEIRKLGDQSRFLYKGKGLDRQWTLVKEDKIVKNHERHPWISNDLFAMVEKSWSNVSINPDGSLSFFQLKEKSGPSGNFASEMKQGQEILSREAEKALMSELLDLFKEKKVIQVSHDSAQGS